MGLKRVLRYVASGAVGMVVTVLLFILMHRLITSGDEIGIDRRDGGLAGFIRTPREEVVRERERLRPEEPPPPEQPPPLPPVDIDRDVDSSQVSFNIDAPGVPVQGAVPNPLFPGPWSPGTIPTNGELLPIVQVEPRYPPEALRERLEGWVRLEFTILADGSVADPEVIESRPGRVFDASARNAILRWRFRPRVVNGEAVAARAELTMDYFLPE
ncbi:MAG TPA: energy transducer TonB [Gammaproteobacteria bacterium]